MQKNIIPLSIIAGSLIIAGAIIYSAILPSSREENEEVAEEGFSLEGEPVIGNANAKITIVEFSDFECPYCAKYVLETYPQIKQAYIDTGKIKMVFKNFPLISIHSYAEIAAQASECANEQGKFWEYKEKLFQNQDALSASNLKMYAKDFGVNESQFNACLDSKKYANEVEQDLEDGISARVKGTPTFLIGEDEKLVGAQPFSAFQKIIEEKLK